MMFEETIPAGTKSTFHLHHDSDEVAMSRVPHAWKNTGAETGRVLFLYTPARAGGLREEQQRTGRKFASMNERELAEICQRHGWELLGPPPL